MCTWNNGSSTIKPLRGSGVVECSRLRVQFHVPWVDTWTVHLRKVSKFHTSTVSSTCPWVVQVVLTTFNDQHLKVVVQVGQPARGDTVSCSASEHAMLLLLDLPSCRATTTDNDINLVRHRHFVSAVSQNWSGLIERVATSANISEQNERLSIFYFLYGTTPRSAERIEGFLKSSCIARSRWPGCD